MAPLTSKQPFKALYTIFFLLKTPPQLILLYLKYLIKPLRPLKEWSATENLLSQIGKIMFQYITATRSGLLLYADPVAAGDRHSHIEPAAENLYSGVLTKSKDVKPGPVDAVWFPSAAPVRDADPAVLKEKVVLHFPGGAYIMAFGHKDSGLEVADAMTKHMKADRTIWAQYRLSHSPETRFPAALQDTLTFYQYVLSLGFDPNNVILSGDSAGGNAVIALLRYLEDRAHNEDGETQATLPLPGGAIVFSPWVNVTLNAGKEYDQYSNAQCDCLWGPLLQWGVDAFIPGEDLSSEVQSYISPLHHPFKTSVPLVIHAGEAEAFYPDIKDFADEMVELNGDRVQYHSTARAAHDILLSHKTFGLTEERAAVLESACKLFEHGSN